LRGPRHIFPTDKFGITDLLYEVGQPSSDGRFTSESRDTGTGRKPFPTASIAAGTTRSPRINDDVPNLTGEAVAATDELASGEEAATDTGSEGHHEKVSKAQRAAGRVFGDRRTVGIIRADEALAGSMRFHQVDEVGPIAARQVRGVGQDSGVRHHAGQSETHGQRNVCTQEFEEGFSDDRGRGRAGRFGNEVRCGPASSRKNDAGGINQYDFDFRTTDVNADGNGGH
jgi:hypothetical protein